MQASVIVFPGSNCDRDVAICLEAATGKKPNMVWHGDSDLPYSDVIVLP
ncbi:MAG: phosphoribosylformylglycinamidine synthase subunit PurQ, partial [Pseudomonadota bacterium]|nr:phosphoribosylformylglycinamidine synthase subunit PurQ [Pseudomonadota bacterium]